MHVEISEDAYKQIHKLAHAAGVGGVEAYLETLAQEASHNGSSQAKPVGPSFTQGLASLGLLGKYDDLPADLSSNPAYLEGFGE